MAITLSIEFSGLVLYVRHPDRAEVGIALPDARMIPKGKSMMLPDGETGVAHVGYLRYNLADTGVAVPRGSKRGALPEFEVIHRFCGEEIDLGLEAGAREDHILEMPDFARIASHVAPIQGLFRNAPSALLMRMVLKGGLISSECFKQSWHFSSVLKDDVADTYGGQFAGFATWTRQIDAPSVTLRVKKLDGIEKAAITLTPSGPDNTIHLKIANLCSDNPVEWPEMRERVFRARYDDDFRWFYTLVERPDATWSEITADGRKFLLPVPMLESTMTKGEEPPDCAGAQIAYAF